MTEEQFWRSNPRIIKVYERIYKEKQNRINDLVYLFVGNYEMAALVTAIDKVLNGRKAKSKYIDKPLVLFPPTEQEKKAAQERAINAFVLWASQTQKKYEGKEDKK